MTSTSVVLESHSLWKAMHFPLSVSRVSQDIQSDTKWKVGTWDESEEKKNPSNKAPRSKHQESATNTKFGLTLLFHQHGRDTFHLAVFFFATGIRKKEKNKSKTRRKRNPWKFRKESLWWEVYVKFADSLLLLCLRSSARVPLWMN